MKLFTILVVFCAFISCKKYELKPEHKALDSLNSSVVLSSITINNGTVTISGFGRATDNRKMKEQVLTIFVQPYPRSFRDYDEPYPVSTTGGNYISFSDSEMNGDFKNQVQSDFSKFVDNKTYVAFLTLGKSTYSSTGYIWNINQNDILSNKVTFKVINGEIKILNWNESVTLDNNITRTDTLNSNVILSKLSINKGTITISGFSVVKDNREMRYKYLTIVVQSYPNSYHDYSEPYPVSSKGTNYISFYGSEMSGDFKNKVQDSFSKFENNTTYVAFLASGSYFGGGYLYDINPNDKLSNKVTFRVINGEIKILNWNEGVFSGRTYITTDSISGKTGTSAICGGEVYGGASVKEKGVCWSILPSPTVMDKKTNEGTSGGKFSSNITGLTPNTTYYVRAYCITSTDTIYGNVISFNAPIGIGASLQGGIVFYIFKNGDPGYIVGQTHGLVMAPTNQSDKIQWYNGSLVKTGATATTIGSGNSNTNKIVNTQGNGNYAAKLCYDLSLGGYDDWYLPSNDELMQLYENIGDIGYVWSSSELDFYRTYYLHRSGFIDNTNKDLNNSVRAIRSF